MPFAATPPAEPRDPRLRRQSRIALWIALLVTLGGVFLLDRVARGPDPKALRDVAKLQDLFDGVDFLRYEEVRLLRDYVAIDTAEPDANELAGAEFLARELAKAGIAAHVESVGGRRANLWAFVEGEDPRALVLAGHLDVEPAATQEGWRFPPFTATIDGPWIYGRGMYDMKSLTIAQLLAIGDVARSGSKPKRSILFLQTSSEESGSDTGTRWILREHPELVARMGLVLTEGGVVEAMSYDQIKYWGVEFGQKRFAKAMFCASEREPLETFADLLRSTGRLDPHPRVEPAVRTFLDAYSSTRGLGYYRDFLAHADRTVLVRSEYDRLTNFMASLFRDEAVPFAVEPAEGGGWQLPVMIHLLPGSQAQDVFARAIPEWKRPALTFHLDEALGSNASSPTDTPDFRRLVGAIEKEFPGVPTGPYFIPWSATDSRFFRGAGIASYGFSPFPVTVTDTLQMGKPNERMQLPAYVRGIALYRSLIAELAGTPWGPE